MSWSELVSRGERSAPGGSAPGGSVPGGSPPGGSAPGGSAPGGSPPQGPAVEERPPATPARALVGIVMGSDSDWPVMSGAAEALDELGVPVEVDVVSAHRMPHDMVAWGASAADRGLRVVVAGAGGAAHLPGMLASVTVLPVVGVPVPLRHLDGLDSLLSIVQMPAGVPVATVGVGAARNAGLLAARILAAGFEDPFATRLRGLLADHAAGLRQTALAKGERLRTERARSEGT